MYQALKSFAFAYKDIHFRRIYSWESLICLIIQGTLSVQWYILLILQSSSVKNQEIHPTFSSSNSNGNMSSGTWTFLLLLVVCVFCPRYALSRTPPNQLPHIVFIVADDLGRLFVILSVYALLHQTGWLVTAWREWWWGAECLMMMSKTVVDVNVSINVMWKIEMFDECDYLQGWNDVGWREPKMHTPNLNYLAWKGIILNNSYVQPLCSP